MKTLEFQIRDPQVHPEDSNELAPMIQELDAGNKETGAVIGLVVPGGEVFTLSRIAFVGSTDEDTQAMDQPDIEHKFFVTSPDQLRPILHLFDVVFPVTEAVLDVIDIVGGGEESVEVRITAYTDPAAAVSDPAVETDPATDPVQGE